MAGHDSIIILLDGDVSAETALNYLNSESYVIAADGGIRHAAVLGLEPDLWIGDFDSSDSELVDRYGHVAQSEFSPDKITSDGELAIEAALDRSPRQIIMIGALGGSRTDHSLFNILSAVRHAHQNPKIEFLLVGTRETARPIIPGKILSITGRSGATLSIVPFSDLFKLSIQGVKWPLKEIQVALGSTHTLSNSIISDAQISLGRGHAIAILQIKD